MLGCINCVVRVVSFEMVGVEKGFEMRGWCYSKDESVECPEGCGCRVYLFACWWLIVMRQEANGRRSGGLRGSVSAVDRHSELFLMSCKYPESGQLHIKRSMAEQVI